MELLRTLWNIGEGALASTEPTFVPSDTRGRFPSSELKAVTSTSRMVDDRRDLWGLGDGVLSSIEALLVPCDDRGRFPSSELKAVMSTSRIVDDRRDRA
jgi:hypothetical protein